jgi:hypothetical protein
MGCTPISTVAIMTALVLAVAVALAILAQEWLAKYLRRKL